MKRLLTGLIFVIASVIIMPFKVYSIDASAEELKCFVGEIQIVPVSNPMRVSISKPAVADVVSVSKSEITLNPKSAGTATLTVWDNFGEQSYRIKVYAEDTGAIKRRIDNILSKLGISGVNTKAEDEEGKVMLLGSIKSPKDKDRIAIALGPLKEKAVDLIVVKEEEASLEIDVQVIEINSGHENDLGFTWPGSVTFTEVGSAALSAGGTTWGKVFHVSNVARSVDGTANPFTLKLDALIQEGKARILSRPRLSCQSGKEAKLVVGGEVPVLSGTVTPGTSGSSSVGATTGGTVEYKEYGIILSINPRLEDSGRVHLNLNVVVSELGDQVETTYALAYKMTKRTATTELFLNDGETMAIGGLIKKKNKETLRRVPWLSEIPVLGAIFRQKTTQQGWNSDTDNLTDTELFITLTPRIVYPQKPQEEAIEKAPAADAPLAVNDKEQDPVLNYCKIIQRKILDNLSYPSEARQLGLQGTVKLSLRLSYQGELLDSKIKESSMSRMLDDDALSAARKIAPYPPFPPAIKENDLWIDIPIIYQLE
ncbi:MAG: TonB family protein [Candidatus Omnitrophota bacterium]